MERWFDGVHLIGRYTWLRTGVWLLAHGGEAAVLELPPGDGSDPAADAATAARELGVAVRYLLCTHTHHDHFCPGTFATMRRQFPRAEPVFQTGFRNRTGGVGGARYFDGECALALGGEPLHLVHAPKHSFTDTAVLFRGAACTGDWELNTARTVNDSVPVEVRRASCDRLAGFVAKRNYHVHRVYSVHANDRREDVDFAALMADTKIDRKLW